MKPIHYFIWLVVLVTTSLLPCASQAQTAPDTVTVGKEVKNGFYHPDSPSLFRTLVGYQRWYEQASSVRHTFDRDSLTVGLLFFNRYYLENNISFVDSMIRRIEGQGHNVIAVVRAGGSQVDTMLIQDGRTQVDVIIQTVNSFRFPDYEKGLEQIRKLDVPVLSALIHTDYTPEEWEKSVDGLNLRMASELTNMFRDGIFEPMVIAGGVKNGAGQKINVPIMYQLNWRVDRALAWARLRRMNNRDKKLVVTFYSEDGGKANVGSHPAYYFNAPTSLIKLMEGMRERGWNIGDKPLPDADELARLLSEETSNVGNWAQGEIDRRVKNGNVVLIPEAQYLGWFQELPAQKQAHLIEKWGPPPGNVMVHTDAAGQRFLVIPRLEFGNVLLTPNPDWGYLQNEKMLYSNDPLPPHHQYYALYCWLQKVYRPNVRLSIFNNLELMERKMVTPSVRDWSGLLTGNYPNVSIKFLMGGGGSKEIMSDLPISYMNTIIPSGLNPNLNELRLKLGQLSDHLIPQLRKELETGIVAETRRLDLGKDLNVDVDSLKFTELVMRLNDYLHEINLGNMPMGTHTLGEVPEGETRVAMVRAMLGDEFEQLMRRHLPQADTSNQIGKMLSAVLLNGVAPDEAQRQFLGAVKDSATAQLALALDYQHRIVQSKQELAQYLNAFDGHYIETSTVDDPIRNPDALPTGRNPYGFDPDAIPTREAYALGSRLADDIIARHRAKQGGYPRKVGFVLWAGEILKNHGVLESEALYMMGVRPVWDSKGKVTGVEIIPREELGRPRIDVVATTSGDYRDGFQDKAQMIEDATRMVTELDEPGNQVRENSLAYRDQFKKMGKTPAEIDNLMAVRVFSPALGTYATSLQNVTKANDTWKNDSTLSNLYLDRMGHAYGKGTVGAYERDYFIQNLQTVDAGVFSRSSSMYGIMDGPPEPASFFGGLQLAVRNTTAERRNVDLYMSDVQDAKKGKVETLEQFYAKELQSRALNPKWLAGMMREGYNGAHYMQNVAENMWAWDVTSPTLVQDKDWEAMNEVFIEDKFGLGMSEFFEKANPFAKQTILSTMLGAAEKGYWKALPQTLAGVSKALAQSVAKNGAGCSSAICNTQTIQRFAVAALDAVPGGQALAGRYMAAIGQARTPDPQAMASATPPASSSAAAQPAAAANRPARPSAPMPDRPLIRGNEIVETVQKLVTLPAPVGKPQPPGAVWATGLLGLLALGWFRQRRLAD